MQRIAAIVLLLFYLQPLRAADELQEIVVKPGETLWSIAQTYLSDPSRWPEILKYNNLPISDSSIPLAGAKLSVPVRLIKEELRKARLIEVDGDVRLRKRAQADWQSAPVKADLYNEDALRTLASARAKVQFHNGNHLTIDQNSFVVLKPELKREEVTLRSGSVRASRMDLITPTARITPKNPDTVYKARVRADRATIVHVEKGRAEVLGLDTGKKVEVSEGFVNITLPDRAPSIPEKMPEMDDFDFPAFSSSGQVRVPKDAVRIPSAQSAAVLPQEKREFIQNFRMDKNIPLLDETSGARSFNGKTYAKFVAYRLVIAKDAQFRQTVYDKIRELTARDDLSARTLGLPDGEYFRRVSYIDHLGKNSDFVVLDPIKVDTLAPKLEISSPEEGQRTREGLVTLSGRTEPGIGISANNYAVPVGARGDFRWSVVLVHEGSNLVTIIAKDVAGNQTIVERTVFLEPSR